MSDWLLRPEVAEKINEVMRRPETWPALKNLAAANTAAAGPAKELTRNGRQAVINVLGVLSNTVDPWAEFFGESGTAYPEIIRQIDQANQDPGIDSILLDIDSPGGTVAGAYETAEAIAGSRKPIDALIRGEAASGAYLLASQARNITAAGEYSRVGSIGVVAGGWVWPDRVEVTSTNAPDKSPDLSTEEGRQVVRDQLDDIHALMVETIGRGRDKSPDDINKNFGRGRMIMAMDALGRGMIDGIQDRRVPSQNTPGGGSMNAQEMQAQHPEAYQAAVAEGITQERARVAAHLKMGSRPGCMGIAVEAIQAGSAMDAGLMDQYMEAALAANVIQNRKDDEPAPVVPEPQAPATPPASGGEDMSDRVAGLVAEKTGLEEE